LIRLAGTVLSSSQTNFFPHDGDSPEKEVSDVNEKRELWRLPGLSLSPENHSLGAWFQKSLCRRKRKKPKRSSV